MQIFWALQVRGLLQLPLAQQVCPEAPHCWHVPPLQIRPEPLQLLLAQQICPEAPHGWQVPPPPQTRPELHWFPPQQG